MSAVRSVSTMSAVRSAVRSASAVRSVSTMSAVRSVSAVSARTAVSAQFLPDVGLLSAKRASEPQATTDPPGKQEPGRVLRLRTKQPALGVAGQENR